MARIARHCERITLKTFVICYSLEKRIPKIWACIVNRLRRYTFSWTWSAFEHRKHLREQDLYFTSWNVIKSAVCTCLYITKYDEKISKCDEKCSRCVSIYFEMWWKVQQIRVHIFRNATKVQHLRAHISWNVMRSAVGTCRYISKCDE